EQIGEGGFGIVFMAEQQEPIRRKIALKVLKPGMDSQQVIVRFEAERQALALMDHPNIAKVRRSPRSSSRRSTTTRCGGSFAKRSRPGRARGSAPWGRRPAPFRPSGKAIQGASANRSAASWTGRNQRGFVCSFSCLHHF